MAVLVARTAWYGPLVPVPQQLLGMCASCLLNRAMERRADLAVTDLVPCEFNRWGSPSWFDLFSQLLTGEPKCANATAPSCLDPSNATPEPITKGAALRQRGRPFHIRLGSISNQGDRYLRSLFVAGALSVIRYAKAHGSKHRPWLTALLARRPAKVAAIALANKLARMAWAMMAKGERYRNPVALAA